MVEVEFYTERGQDVITDFLLDLSAKHRAKAYWEIKLLESMGKSLKGPHVDHFEGELWELRIKFASDISRIFYFYPSPTKIVLLHGFVKKTQKTPKREIEIAKKRLKEYLQRQIK